MKHTHRRLLIGLLSLLSSVVLAGCSAQATKPTEIELNKAWRLGIAQTASGVYVVCETCPKRTPKTPYRERLADASAVIGRAVAHDGVEHLSATADMAGKAASRVAVAVGAAAGRGVAVPVDVSDKPNPAIQASGPLLSLLFPFDVSIIQPEHKPQLERFVREIWPTLPVLALTVVGHTDSVGGKPYNDTLARKRAESVAEALRQLGVGSVEVHAEGKCCYVADNAKAQGRAKNRRAEIHLFTNPR